MTTIKSARLTYRKFQQDDFDTYLSMMSDREIVKYITTNPLTEEESRDRFEMVMDQTTRETNFGYYLAFHGQDCIGLMKLVRFRADDFELGYALFPKFWGMGFGSEMISVFVEFARLKEVKHLTAVVNPENSASIHLLEKHGFILETEGLFKEEQASYYGLTF